VPNHGTRGGDRQRYVIRQHVRIKNKGVLQQLKQQYGSSGGWTKEYEYRFDAVAEVMIEAHRFVHRRRGLRFGRDKVPPPR
jgi:hypothetical protein